MPRSSLSSSRFRAPWAVTSCCRKLKRVSRQSSAKQGDLPNVLDTLSEYHALVRLYDSTIDVVGTGDKFRHRS